MMRNACLLPRLRSSSCLQLISPLTVRDVPVAGTLDQGSGWLEVFEEEPQDAIYPAALEAMASMGNVVDTLFKRSQKVMV